MTSDEDARWLVVDGRRWRRQDPLLAPTIADRLTSHLGRARSAVGALKRAGEDPAPARARVGLAKHGLGERGTPWWELTEAERRARARASLEELDRLAPPGD